MPILKKWNIEIFDNKLYLTGIVYGHTSYSCSSGRTIHTSNIKSVEYSEDAPDILLVHTRNTLYTLKLKDHRYVYRYKEPDIDLFYVNTDTFDPHQVKQEFKVLSEKHHCPDLSQKVLEFARQAGQAHSVFLTECDKLLSERMLMMELDAEEYSYQYKCVYKNSKGELLTDANAHFELYREFADNNDVPFDCNIASLNIDFYKQCHISFSIIRGFAAFKKNGPEPFCEEGRHLGYIRNAGKLPMFVRFSWGKILLVEPNETFPVYYEQTGTDPDIINERYDHENSLYRTFDQTDMFNAPFIGTQFI